MPGIEIWLSPLEVPDTVTSLRPQLPVNAPLNGLPACGEEGNQRLGTTSWSWGTATDFITVDVAPNYPNTGARGPGSEVTITTGKDTTPETPCGPPPAPPVTPDTARKSGLLGVTMPQGSTLTDSAPGHELWKVPGSVTDVSSTMSGQLPIGKNLGDRQWCRADPASGDSGPTWYWRTPAGDSITVDVNPTFDSSSSSVVVTGQTVQTSLAQDGCVGS